MPGLNEFERQVSEAVRGPLKQAGFAIGPTGGGVMLWGIKTPGGHEVLLCFGDNRTDGDPDAPEWAVDRAGSDAHGGGFLRVDGLRLEQAISLAPRLPDPKGHEITVTAGGSEDMDALLAGLVHDFEEDQHPCPR